MKKIFLLSLTLFCFLLNSEAQNVFKQKGIASFYADKFEGRTTASGEKYRGNKMTAAHLLLPFGTMVKVTNLKNGKTVEVEINDRGPFVEGRIIDVSKIAAEELGFMHEGLVEVSIEVIEHSDDMEAGKVVIKQPHRDQPKHQKEYYEVHATKLEPKGFGVQIGTFREMVNMMDVTHHLKSAYEKDVIIEVVDLNGVKVYKVIIGNRPNRKKASDLQMELKADYPDSFIYEF
jgi:rare lipoprotein A